MNQRPAVAAAILCCLSAACAEEGIRPVAAPPATVPIETATGELTDRIHAIATTAIDRGPVVGLSIAVVRDGAIVHSHGYGMADREAGRSADEATLYNIASTSKILTAAAVLRLTDEGRLSLDQDVASALPEFPNEEQGLRISLRRLLNHTAGLSDYWTADIDRWIRTGEPLAPEVVLDFVRDRPLGFEPGSHWIYSNTGFYLAGMAVARAAERPWADFVLEELVRPLELSSFVLCDEADERRMEGYGVVDGEVRRMSEYFFEEGVRGDAGFCATAEDLARLPSALMASDLLSDEAKRSLVTPTALTTGAVVDYGLGTALGTYEGHRLWGHLGGGPTGYVAALLHFPNDGLTVAALVNTGGGSVGALIVAGDVARAALGLGDPAPLDLPLEPDEQALYAGPYVGSRFGIRYDVVAEGTRIARVGPGDSSSMLPLLPQGDHFFGRADWPMDRFVFHTTGDDPAVGFSAYYYGVFDGYWRRVGPTEGRFEQ